VQIFGMEQNKERPVSTPISPISVTLLPLPAGRKLIEASSSIRAMLARHFLRTRRFALPRKALLRNKLLLSQ
jgi:hypothetical protein